jgi:hypothetical protein
MPTDDDYLDATPEEAEQLRKFEAHEKLQRREAAIRAAELTGLPIGLGAAAYATGRRALTGEVAEEALHETSQQAFRAENEANLEALRAQGLPRDALENERDRLTVLRDQADTLRRNTANNTANSAFERWRQSQAPRADATMTSTRPSTSASERPPPVDQLAEIDAEIESIEDKIAARVKSFNESFKAAQSAQAAGLPAKMATAAEKVAEYRNLLTAAGKEALRESVSLPTAAASFGVGLPVLLAGEMSSRGEIMHPLRALASSSSGLGRSLKAADFGAGSGAYDLLIRNMDESAKLFDDGVISWELWQTLQNDERGPAIWQEQAEAMKASPEQLAENRKALERYEERAI